LSETGETKALTLISIVVIALSIFVSTAGFITFFSLEKLGSNLPIDSINQFRNISNLQALISTLSSDLDSIQADKQDIGWDELKFTINKLQVSQSIIMSDFNDKPPGDLQMILDEVSLLCNDLRTTIEIRDERARSEILLSKNQVNYIFSELRDYIVRSNNSHLLILEGQRARMGILNTLVLILSLLALCSATLSIVLLRSRERAFAQLLKARETALAASRTKSEFLSNISHEIRTPMNTIMGLSYLALKTDLSPSQRDYIRRIQLSGQHLLGIINDILDFSKIEAGRLSLEAIPFELDKVLDTVSNLILEKASMKGLELIFDVEKSIPSHLIGDPLRLGQILINLANNAIKFTEKGEISIRVRLKSESRLNVVLYFEVRDTGIGITDEQKARLFQSFEQADRSITRQYGGSGLGLAISKSLVELMGGQIGVESVYKKGSTFWFTAQLGRDTGERPAPKYSADLRGKKVLVVDDNDHSRAVFNEMLSTMGFTVSSAASGAAAIEEIISASRMTAHYEIVFLDWKMPEMNGIDTARKIKELRLSPEPHFVIITSYGREEVIREAAVEGIKTVLIKPISASILFDTVIQLLHPQAEEKHGESSSGENQDNPPTRIGLDGIRVLLVEDNMENQLVATEILKDVGCAVTVAPDGLAAVDTLKESVFDIVLMDMQMPVLDGLTATQEIRKLPGCASLPIIAMTANAMKEEKERCMRAGMNDYITKPINPPLLFETLLRFTPSGVKAAPLPIMPMPEADRGGLPKIPGIETEKSLGRMMGNEDLYIKLLRLFAREQCTSARKIRSALDINDYRTAELLAHTLKGSAATIGAVEVQHGSEELENAIRGKETAGRLTEAVQRLESLLTDTIARIDKGLAEIEKSSVRDMNPAAKNECETILTTLTRFVAENDSEAIDYFELMYEQLAALCEPEHFKQLEAYMRSYNYPEAQKLLEHLGGRSASDQG